MRIVNRAIAALALGLLLSPSGCWSACDGRWKYDPPLDVCMKQKAQPRVEPEVAPSSQPSGAPVETGPASQPSG